MIFQAAAKIDFFFFFFFFLPEVLESTLCYTDFPLLGGMRDFFRIISKDEGAVADI